MDKNWFIDCTHVAPPHWPQWATVPAAALEVAGAAVEDTAVEDATEVVMGLVPLLPHVNGRGPMHK